jgi:hypothetical protein
LLAKEIRADESDQNGVINWCSPPETRLIAAGQRRICLKIRAGGGRWDDFMGYTFPEPGIPATIAECSKVTMSRITVAIVVLSACSAACLPAAGVARAEEVPPVLRELREITHPGGQRLERKDIDYHRLAAAIPPALELADKPPGLWSRFALPSPSGPIERTLYDYLATAVGTAGDIAPTREDREKWYRLELDLTLRMLRHPETRRIYAEEGWGRQPRLVVQLRGQAAGKQPAGREVQPRQRGVPQPR